MVEIPIATLENATKTLWAYKRNLVAAVAGGHKGQIEGAVADIEMLAKHSRHASVRTSAAQALELQYDPAATAGALPAPPALPQNVAGDNEAVTA